MDQRKAVSSSGPRKPFRWVLTLVGPMLVGSFAACGGGDDAVGLPSFAAGALEAYVKASNTGADDVFGRSVALDGDTLVIGAPNEKSSATGINGNQDDNSANLSGAVYVFVRDPVTRAWSQQAYVKASNAEAGDQFGDSVALDGDTLAVGAPGEASSAMGINGTQTDNSAVISGAVYVFVRDPATGVWSQQAYLKASNTGAGDFFGGSVALDGDTLAVGAYGEASSATGINGTQDNNSAGGSGAVYVFTRTGGVWSQQAYVKASNTGAGDGFGWSVALNGNTLAVGAPAEASSATGINGNQDDNSANLSGAVYVFVRDPVTRAWSQQAYVKASNAEAGDQFGDSVALDGDTLAVGAPGEASSATGINGTQDNNSAGGSGAVYVFMRNSAAGVWSQQAYVKASNAGAGDLLGTMVTLVGNTLAVGAPGEASNATGINGTQTDNSALISGAVYVFVRTGGVWSQQAYVKASNTEAGDGFGWSVALGGDTLAVGTPGEASSATGINGTQTDNSAVTSGAVYVYRAQ